VSVRHVGLDFGTTNSSLAVRGADGEVRVAVFPSLLGPTESFRSILYFPRQVSLQRSLRPVLSGESAIAKYLGDEEPKGRLIQSVKSFAADRTFTSTVISGRPSLLENWSQSSSSNWSQKPSSRSAHSETASRSAVQSALPELKALRIRRSAWLD
jgi:molecular chaperone DnaK (HSP70)